MASSVIVHQGLQSCLEPDQVIESSLVIQQKNKPKSSKLPQEINNNIRKWSFLQVLENPSMGVKNNLEDSDEVYVHPMVKRSASALSTKSLEMCTESLGSETGSDVSESGDEFSSISMEERERVRAIQRSKCYNRSFDRKIREFPPPLTSISGGDGTVKVRHHREGGRLVIKAVSVSNCGTNFRAERTNGRLKLSLLKDCSVNYESERVEYDNYESERVLGENYEEGGDQVESSEDEDVSSDDDVAVAVVAVAADEEEEGEEDGGVWRTWTVGCPTGKGEVKRLTRCKEGGNGNKVFANWRSSWVAIS